MEWSFSTDSQRQEWATYWRSRRQDVDQKAIAKLPRERAVELVKLAEELEE